MKKVSKSESVAPHTSKRGTLENFLSLQTQIFTEREKLVARLAEIDGELAKLGFNATVRHYGLRTPTGRVRNPKSLKKLVVEILAAKPLTKDEVYDAVLRSGYQFSTNDPLNSLGVVLYGKSPCFKRVGKKFSL
ncbi:MAG: hypothetical protein ACXWIU_08365 [Limisphaerales bacterium]